MSEQRFYISPVRALPPVRTLVGALLIVGGLASAVRSEEDYGAAPEIAADESLASEFSAELAARALDHAATHWVGERRCVACHTIGPYLMARPLLPGAGAAPEQVRAFVERVVAERLEAEPKLPVDGISAVGVQVAVALAVNDRLTTGVLHPLTREALDRMWSRQRADGGWQWPFRDSPPIKLDEHFGVTLAAIAAGSAPGGYAETSAARTGLEGVLRYLNAHPAETLHQRGMLSWAGTLVPGLADADERRRAASDLLAAQRGDGGWSLANLVANVTRESTVPEPLAARFHELVSQPGYGTQFLAYVGREHVYPSSLESDGYATGFAVFIARQAGVPATDPHLIRGVAWLKRNQRASGRWFTPSQAFHTQHLISNVGSAWSVMALAACGELPQTSAPR